jgi:hypothetical protein
VNSCIIWKKSAEQNTPLLMSCYPRLRLLCSVSKRILYHLSLRAEQAGVEARWGRYFSCTSRSVPRPIQPPVQWIPGLSGGKAAGALC